MDPYWVTQIFGASRDFGLADMELCRIKKRQLPRSKRRLKGKSMGLGNGSDGEFAGARVDATDQRWLFFARTLDSEIGQQFHITRRDISKCLCRGPCICRRHVRYAIMSYPLFDIDRIEMGGRTRCFRASPLINCDVHDHAAWFHFSQHRPRDQFWRFGSWQQDRADE